MLQYTGCTLAPVDWLPPSVHKVYYLVSWYRYWYTIITHVLGKQVIIGGKKSVLCDIYPNTIQNISINPTYVSNLQIAFVTLVRSPDECGRVGLPWVPRINYRGKEIWQKELCIPIFIKPMDKQGPSDINVSGNLSCYYQIGKNQTIDAFCRPIQTCCIYIVLRVSWSHTSNGFPSCF